MAHARDSVVKRARKERLAIISAVLNETVVRFATRPSRDELRELVQKVIRALEGRSVTTLFQRSSEALDVREVERADGEVEFVVYDVRDEEGRTRFQQWRHYMTRALHGGGTTQPTFQDLDDELLVQRFRLVVAHPRVASTEDADADAEEGEEEEEEEQEVIAQARGWDRHSHEEEASVEEQQVLALALVPEPEPEPEVLVVDDAERMRTATRAMSNGETEPEPALAPNPDAEHEWYHRRSREIMREGAQQGADETASYIDSAYSTDVELSENEVAAWRRGYPANATRHERALNRYVDTFMVQQARLQYRSLAKGHLQRVQQRLEEEMGRVAEGHEFGEGAYVEMSNALRQAFLALEEL
jgi:hypothetical protein